MTDPLSAIRAQGLHAWFKERTGLELSTNISQLREAQIDALEWAFGRSEPYLLLNAPTGTGKTLINLVYAAASAERWTYGVHTIRLQQQVADSVPKLPILTGRSNHPCLVGRETYGFDVSADRGVCVIGDDCDEQGSAIDESTWSCPYYSQLYLAMREPARVTNYSMLLALAPLRFPNVTNVLVADEAHNVEDVVTNSLAVTITGEQLRRAGYWFPSDPDPLIYGWRGWAFGLVGRIPRNTRDFVLLKLRANALSLANASVDRDAAWIVDYQVGRSVTARPLWGANYVRKALLGHTELPETATLYDRSDLSNRPRISKAMFTSATLMGADYIADTLGLPLGSWAYLDMPSGFRPKNRPINFAPIEYMNHRVLATESGRASMQNAIDKVIEKYIVAGKPWGIIHSVSNKYRDHILTESRWRGIMVSDPSEHAANVAERRPSVLVAANLSEGWDGYDDLCRFVILPKVPFPDLSDKYTAARRAADQRSYDWRALVSVVQGVGRGVRHREDYADAWILDATWRTLYRKRKDWLPDSFLVAYQGEVSI